MEQDINIYVQHYRFPATADDVIVAERQCKGPGKPITIGSIDGQAYRYRRGGPDRSLWQPNPRGGWTIAVLSVDGQEYEGVAHCSLLDAYSYDIGRSIAEGRAYKAAGLLRRPRPRWANQPMLKRLEVVHSGRLLFFKDTETEEMVIVSQLYANPVESIVNVGGSGTQVPLGEPKVVGQNDATRDVWGVVTSEHCEALRVGLTVHRSFFSSQPHPFEVESEPDDFEEVFAVFGEEGAKVIVEGEGGWRNGRRVDAAWPVRPGQLLSIPLGWHRVTALPRADGTAPRVWYWWAYLALHDGWEKNR